MADAVVRHVVTFGRVLREVGLEVGPGRVADALRGIAAVDLRPRPRLAALAPLPVRRVGDATLLRFGGRPEEPRIEGDVERLEILAS